MARKFTQNELSDLTNASNSYVDATGKTQTFQKVEVPFNYKRGNPGPLDKSSTWTALSAAEKYAKEDPTAYVGQLITVNDGNGVSAYVIDNEAGVLKSLATGGSADEILNKLNNEIDRSTKADDYISSEVSTLITTTLPLSVSNLESSLSIGLTYATGTGDVLSTYTLTQGGQLVGTIDIPKDKVIEEAAVVTYKTDEEAAEKSSGQATKAGTYLKFKIQNQSKELYVPVPELVNTYKGYDGDTVKLDVVHGSGEDYTISASVKSGSIGFEHMTDEVTAYIDALDKREKEDRAAITILSGDETVDGSVKKALKDAKDYTDDSVSNLSSELHQKIDDEIDRATTAEEANAAAIAAETQRAEAKENELSNDIIAEAAEAREAEQKNANAISAETQRAELAEQANAAAIAAEQTRAEGEESTLSGLIEAEAATARAAEQANADAVAAEETRAKEKENVLSGLIDTERTDRTAADSTLQSNINNLSTTLTTAINTETSTREAQDAALDAKITANAAAIAAEASRATIIENTISSKLDAEIARATGKEGELATAINDEKSRALTAEAGLQANIDAEETRATTAEAGLQANIDALSTYADTTFETKADATTKYEDLTGQIDAEATARSNADIALNAAAALSVQNLSNEIYNDVNGGKAALTGDNKIATIKDVVGLSGVIHFRGADDTFISGDATTIPDTEWYTVKGNKPAEGDIIINSSTSKEFLFTGTYSATDPTAGKWHELGDEGLYATKEDLKAEIARAKAAEEANASAIEAETTRATGKEGELATAINDEKSRALTAEAGLQAAIEAEETRAKGVEQTLSNDINAKIFIKDPSSDDYKDGKYTDLSVIKVTEEEYMAKVADGTLLTDGVLYVVSADHINAYGQQIVNVAAPSADNDAANKKYVDDVAKSVEEKALSAIELNGLEFTISENKATLNISTINCGTASSVL